MRERGKKKEDGGREKGGGRERCYRKREGGLVGSVFVLERNSPLGCNWREREREREIERERERERNRARER